MFKKTITTIALLGALSISLFGKSLNPIDQKIVNGLQSTISNKIDVERYKQVGWFGDSNGGGYCNTTIKLLGMDYGFTIKDVSGNMRTYNLIRFGKNLNKYIEHIYDRYKKEDNIELLYSYVSFFSRGINKNSELIKFIPNNSILRNTFYGENILSLKVYNYHACEMFDFIFQSGYQGSERYVGFNDPKFHQFLSYIIQQNFESADKLVEEYDGKKIRSEAIKILL